MTSARIPSTTVVAVTASVMIAAALGIRVWLAATGDFYWDDLVLIGRASTTPILSWEYLGHSHDGHLMPGAFLVAGIATVLAPVNWWAAAVTLVVLQALASLSVWRMIRVIAPHAGPGALAALAFYLFTPMTVPAFAWWSAALNTLPMQAAMAWVIADAVLLTRRGSSGRARYTIVVRSTIVLVLALTFFEKSLLILPVAAVAAMLVAGPRVALVRARALWVSMTAVSAAWAVLFFVVADPTAGEHSVRQTATLVWRSINDAIVPALVGGPWDWRRWTQSPPIGQAPSWMIAAGWLLLAAGIAWALVRRRPTGQALGRVTFRPSAVPVVAFAVFYAMGAQAVVLWNRSSLDTAPELAQTMRYLPDTAVVIVAAWAILLARRGDEEDPPSTAAGTDEHPAVEDAEDHSASYVAMVLAVALGMVSSTISTVAFATSWRDNPTGDYLANARRALQERPGEVMFDQALPLEILLPVTYPQNQISHTFGRLDDRVEFGSSTEDLRVLDTAGDLVPGAVAARRTFAAGPGSCGSPEIIAPTTLRFDGPLVPWTWTLAIPYCADRDGVMRVRLGDPGEAVDGGGEVVDVPVRSGRHQVYVRLRGGGDTFTVRPMGPELRVYLGHGVVGDVGEARYVW